MPAALAFPIGSRLPDWRDESEPEPRMGGRHSAHVRGTVLGGSSSINGMIYRRGTPWTTRTGPPQPGVGGLDEYRQTVTSGRTPARRRSTRLVLVTSGLVDSL